MGIIQKIKDIFKKKEIETEQAKPEVVQPVEPQVSLGSPTGEKCDICGFEITTEQKIVHKFGKAYHSKPCFKDRMKEARKILGQ